MAQRDTLRKKILSGRSDNNVRFEDVCRYLENELGFVMRIKGDHHILAREGVEEIINLQPRQDGTAKPYQIRQVRRLMEKYQL